MPRVLRRTAAAALLLAVGYGMRHAGRPHGVPSYLASGGHQPRRRSVWRRLAPASAALLAAGGARGAETTVMARESAFFSDVDADSDGFVSLDEYMADAEAGFQKWQPSEASRERSRGTYRRLFAASDIDGDGRLCEREVEYLWYLAKQFASSRAERQIARVVTKLQAHDGPHGEEAAAEMEVMPDEFGQALGVSLLAGFDTDGNGRVVREEFLAGIEDVAAAKGWQEYLDDPEVVEWMDGIWERSDVSGDGAWDAKETHYSSFLVMSALDSGIFLERTITSEMFRDLDTNRDGRVEKEEVDKAVERDAEITGEPSIVRRIRDWFAEADMDGDGSLDRQEGLELAKRIRDEM